MQLNQFFKDVSSTVSFQGSENRSHDLKMICVFIYKFQASGMEICAFFRKCGKFVKNCFFV